MEIRASTQFIRVSPRKVRLVADAVRALPVPLAVSHLQVMQKQAAQYVGKTLKSCIANAVNNMKLKEDTLFIKSIMVDEGPSFKRFRPVSRGMAHSYKRRTSHITIILGTRPTPLLGTKQPEKKAEAPAKKADAILKGKEAKPKKTTAVKKPAKVAKKGIPHGTKNKS